MKDEKSMELTVFSNRAIRNYFKAHMYSLESKSRILKNNGRELVFFQEDYPDEVVVEDLLDSMCAFVSANVDNDTILSQFRMNSNPLEARLPLTIIKQKVCKT